MTAGDASRTVPRAIRVDPDLCAASGTCTRIAPELFELGPTEDHVRVVGNPVSDAESLSRARRAEENCPMQAIEVVPGSGRLRASE